MVKVDQATGEIGGSVLHSGRKGAFLDQFFKIGKFLPLLPEAVEKAVIHAVETDEQDPLEFGFFQIPGPLDKTQQGADREGKEIKNGKEKSRENEKKRTDKSETGPGPT